MTLFRDKKCKHSDEKRMATEKEVHIKENYLQTTPELLTRMEK